MTVTRDMCVQAMFGTGLGTTTAGNGSVMLDPIAALYPYGTVVRLTAVPQTGNYFAAWGNAVSSTNNPLLFTLSNANPTVSCAFAPLSAGQSALTVLVNGRGRATTSPRANRYNTSQAVTLRAIAEADQDFFGWTGDATGTQTNVTVLMNQSRVITANFTSRPRLTLGPCLGGWVDGRFQLTLNGDFGVRYEIHSSPNASDWSPLVTVTNTFGVTQFVDPATNATQRFYRARVAP